MAEGREGPRPRGGSAGAQQGEIPEGRERAETSREWDHVD